MEAILRNCNQQTFNLNNGERMKENEVSNVLEGEEVGQVKMSKIEKFFISQKEKFNKHLAGFEGRIADKVNKFVAEFNQSQTSFITQINQAVATMDKKYGGMYNMLIKKFLVEMENRVYTSELSNKTMLVIFAEKFHKIESDLNKTNPELGTALSLTDYLKQMEGNYALKMTEIHNASEKALAEDQAEKENVEPVQEEAKAEAAPTEESAVAQ